MELLLQAAECSDGPRSTESVCSSSTTTSRSSYSHHLSPSRSNNMSSLPPKKRMKLNFDQDAVSSESSFQLPRSVSVVSSGMSTNSTTFHGSSSSSFYTDSPALNSDWTTTTTATQGPQASTFIHPLFNSVIVPNRSVYDKKSSRRIPSKKSKSLKRQRIFDSSSNSSRAAKKKPSLVRDVDGNDMCMGYFSMPARNQSQSPDIAFSPAPEEPASPVAVETLPANTVTVNRRQVTPQDANREEPPKQRWSEIAPPQMRHSTTAPVVTIPLDKPEHNPAIAAKTLLYQAYLRALNQAPMNQ
mmetsp:Transcript_11596/g.25068  ORF Transcript_11596/g.25068 Transcript_11596/m.25068 type:complete len:300 (+) Transcript_11596:2-901(+)